MVEPGQRDDRVRGGGRPRHRLDCAADALGTRVLGTLGEEVRRRLDRDIMDAGRQVMPLPAAARRHIQDDPRVGLDRCDGRFELGIARPRAHRHRVAVAIGAEGENVCVAVEHRTDQPPAIIAANAARPLARAVAP